VVREFRIAIDDLVPRTAEHSGLGIRQIPRHVQHLRINWISRDAGDDDAACGQIDHQGAAMSPGVANSNPRR